MNYSGRTYGAAADRTTFAYTVSGTNMPIQDTATVPTVTETTVSITIAPQISTIQVTNTPFVTATVLPVTIILEGAIDEIEQSNLIVYDIRIQVERDAPILKVLRHGQKPMAGVDIARVPAQVITGTEMAMGRSRHGK